MLLDSLETQTATWDLVARMAAAVILAGLIGLERELRARPAGLRTNMLVSLAAATFTLLSFEMVSDSEALSDAARVDPLRVLEAVVAGVAFLGAGAIIRGGDGDRVKGVTTGASLWMSGSVGVACGGGHFVVAGLATVFAIILLYVLGAVERRAIKPRIDRKEG